MQKLLHVGCGMKDKSQTTQGFANPDWVETRYDIDQSVTPDVVGSLVDLAAFSDETMDAVFSSHNIEHLYPHEVPQALSEFCRVLNDDGYLVITCPDLRGVCELVAQDRLLEAAYESPAGPIAPIDILYGFRKALAEGNLYMAHRCGFTEKVLSTSLHQAGFETAVSMARPAPFYDLFALGSKRLRDESEMRSLAGQHFPGI
ncbi:methyltransferase domain-containing protein [Luminiphilus sp.]|nr:methyltransferase domain-containing protein [Luminiphilus sp.]